MRLLQPLPTTLRRSTQPQTRLASSAASPILRGQCSLVHHLYEPFPRRFNVTTFQQTKLFACDPCHPYHIKVQRSIKDFDPTRFIWCVRCPVSVCRKPTYRHEIEKKFRRAFRAELERNGYHHDGTVIADASDAHAHAHAHERREALSGALLVVFRKDVPNILQATAQEIRDNARSVLSRVREQQTIARRTSSRPRTRPGQRAQPAAGAHQEE